MDLFKDRTGVPHIKPPWAALYHRSSVYGLAGDKKGIIVVKPTWNGLWELPGGGLDMNEEVRRGLNRELCEETGYQFRTMDPDPLAEWTEHFYADDEERFYESHCGVYRISGLTYRGMLPNNEIEDICRMPLDQLNRDNCKERFLKVLRTPSMIRILQ
jgi:8-oxo-dGTP pyrophosphatase MutT (NUDIX family)